MVADDWTENGGSVICREWMRRGERQTRTKRTKTVIKSADRGNDPVMSVRDKRVLLLPAVSACLHGINAALVIHGRNRINARRPSCLAR